MTVDEYEKYLHSLTNEQLLNEFANRCISANSWEYTICYNVVLKRMEVLPEMTFNSEE